jgi:transposase
MKQDGRTLDHGTLETIRTMAVARVHEGGRPNEVIASYGVHRCTIYRWLEAVRGCGQGLRASAARPATGRPRTLTAGQERQVFRWISGKNPRPYGFDCGRVQCFQPHARLVEPWIYRIDESLAPDREICPPLGRG